MSIKIWRSQLTPKPLYWYQIKPLAIVCFSKMQMLSIENSLSQQPTNRLSCLWTHAPSTATALDSLQFQIFGYHVMRHASISHLDRVQHIHAEQLNLFSSAAHQRIVRIRGPPPRAPRLTYREVADNIYNFKGQWHRRKCEKESQMIQDILKLADFCNGDMEDEDTWPIKHY